MKKINEADSRMLNAGMVVTGILAKNEGGLPGGFRYYGYCRDHKEGFYTNMFIRLDIFQLKHRHCKL